MAVSPRPRNNLFPFSESQVTLSLEGRERRRAAIVVNCSLEPREHEAGNALACRSRPPTPKVTLDFDAA
jgi:hypothetical protein